MTLIEITVPESFVRRGIDSLEDEIERINTVLDCFEENDLEKTDPYYDLLAKREDLEIRVEDLEEEIDESKEAGLAELFE